MVSRSDRALEKPQRFHFVINHCFVFRFQNDCHLRYSRAEAGATGTLTTAFRDWFLPLKIKSYKVWLTGAYLPLRSKCIWRKSNCYWIFNPFQSYRESFGLDSQYYPVRAFITQVLPQGSSFPRIINHENNNNPLTTRLFDWFIPFWDSEKR